MKIAINILFALIILGLGYFLVESINEPIRFKREKDKRERAVIDKLMLIRECQDMYRQVRGSFADNFDTLSHVLRTGNFRTIKVIGDPDDPNYTGEITYDTIYTPAFDSIQSMGIALDKLSLVPYGDGAEFEIQADTIIYQQTETFVVEVGVVRKKYMGLYGSIEYTKYDKQYNPNSVIKFGDMNNPNLSGNWE